MDVDILIIEKVNLFNFFHSAKCSMKIKFFLPKQSNYFGL